MSAAPTSDTRRSSTSIDCETTVRRLWDYLDNRLPAWSHAEVEAHLAICALCPPHFDFARSMQRALAASSQDDDTDEEAARAERLRERIRGALRADGAWKAGREPAHGTDG